MLNDNQSQKIIIKKTKTNKQQAILYMKDFQGDACLF